MSAMAGPWGVAISLFSGAGGLDLGVEAAGYHVAAAVEIDQDAADTMEKNFSDLVSPLIRRSILDVPTKEIVRAAGLRGRERPDLLVGGPLDAPRSPSQGSGWNGNGRVSIATCVSCRHTQGSSPKRDHERSSLRTSTHSRTTTRRAGPCSSDFSAKDR